MTPARIGDLVDEVKDLLHAEDGPDMVAILDLAGQLDLSEED